MPAEYCSPVWNQSSHANKLNTPFNEAFRTINECIKPTHINFLLFLAGFKSLKNCCHYARKKLLCQANDQDHLFHQTMYFSRKVTRLRSRRPLRSLDQTVFVADYSVPNDLAEFIPQWSNEPSGCKLPRK